MTTSRLPQFMVIRNYIEQMIAAKRMQANDKLPSERLLSEDLNITRITLRDALFQLEAEGMIYRQDRRGWFVSPQRITYDPSLPTGFMQYVTEQGRTPKTKVLRMQRVPCDTKIASKFNKKEGEPIFELERVRYVDDREVLLELIYIDPALFPDADQLDFSHSLTSTLRARYGVTPEKHDLTMFPTVLMDNVAKQLKVVSGAAGLYISRTSYFDESRIFEYNREYWRPDAVQIKMEVLGARPE